MRIIATCSHCHVSNDISNGPTFCKSCRHRADVPRMDCDCERCAPEQALIEAFADEPAEPTPIEEFDPDWEDDLEAARRWLGEA